MQTKLETEFNDWLQQIKYSTIMLQYAKLKNKSEIISELMHFLSVTQYDVFEKQKELFQNLTAQQNTIGSLLSEMMFKLRCEFLNLRHKNDLKDLLEIDDVSTLFN